MRTKLDIYFFLLTLILALVILFSKPPIYTVYIVTH